MTVDTVGLGVDLGGTTYAAALVDTKGRFLEIRHGDTIPEAGPEAVVDRLADAVRELLAARPEARTAVQGVGMGIPGLVDAEHGVVRLAPNVGWRDVPVRDMMQQALDMPVAVDNDVRCALLGERFFGAGAGIDDLMLVAVGTGVGSGTLIGGRLLRGAGGFAGEIGHQTLEADGPVCGCGNPGCLEALAGGIALVRNGRELLQQGMPTALQGLIDQGERLTPALIHKAAAAGDQPAVDLLAESGRYIGVALANMVNMLNPKRIIIGGGIARAGAFLLGPLEDEVRRRSLAPSGAMVEIVPAQLGEHAGVVGAAALVTHKHRFA